MQRRLLLQFVLASFALVAVVAVAVLAPAALVGVPPVLVAASYFVQRVMTANENIR